MKICIILIYLNKRKNLKLYYFSIKNILILFNILIIKNKNEVILYLNAKKNK